ncbi:MAG: hypothetical protein MZW92_81860 [Comamonadaceae bacterium]|nr:hypothetical protein [Comamonadaceae bacterium]
MARYPTASWRPTCAASRAFWAARRPSSRRCSAHRASASSRPIAMPRSRRYSPICWGWRRSARSAPGRRETAKLLKLGLASQRQGLGALQAEAEQLAQQRTALGDTQARVDAGERAKRAAQAALDEAKQALATLMAHRDVAMQTEARRTQLAGERKALIEAGKAAIGSLDEQDRRELERLALLDRRLAQRADAVAARRAGARCPARPAARHAARQRGDPARAAAAAAGPGCGGRARADD